MIYWKCYLFSFLKLFFSKILSILSFLKNNNEIILFNINFLTIKIIYCHLSLYLIEKWASIFWTIIKKIYIYIQISFKNQIEIVEFNVILTYLYTIKQNKN